MKDNCTLRVNYVLHVSALLFSQSDYGVNYEIMNRYAELPVVLACWHEAPNEYKPCAKSGFGKSCDTGHSCIRIVYD
jgi:hypothetical protein